MNVFEKAIKKIKQFKPTSWSIDNRTAIYIIAILVTIYGLTKFNTMPKTGTLTTLQKNSIICWVDAGGPNN